MSCLDPVVRKVPKGDWFCPRCAPRPETDIVDRKTLYHTCVVWCGVV
jgi:hypothetical protein